MKRLSRKLLKEYRAAHGLSQQHLALRLGVHRVTVTHWESGVHRIPGWLGTVLQVLEPRQRKGGPL